MPVVSPPTLHICLPGLSLALMQWQIKFRFPILSRLAQFETTGLSLDGTRPYILTYPVTKWDS